MGKGTCSGCGRTIGDDEDYVDCSYCRARVHRLAACCYVEGSDRYCPSCWRQWERKTWLYSI